MTTPQNKPQAKLPQVGEKLGRYSVERVEDLPEMSGKLVLLRHENGARHAHVAREDDNLVFGVTFPTVPKDSTGVAHILEHNVLMGSQNYPVPDPFFSMIPRSLNTFMNAMTSNDWTTYPFSTRNVQDYYNLMSVYLDAAFFPLLRYESFLQDGHRFEFETPDDSGTPLKLQGVVYNEMKGAMASPGSVMWRAFGKALYPDLTYANNSGGAPENIPELTYEGLKAFHAAHYHPSNGYFFSYGNQDLRRVLDTVEEKVMSKFQKQELDVSIPDQHNFDAPRREEVSYPSSDTERGGQVLVGWKLGRTSDPDLSLRWNVLSDILVGNAAAPLRRPLIESGLGAQLADLSGYIDNFREGAFGVGLKGLSAGKADEVEKLVLDTIAGIVREGIDPALIEASLHQFEIQQKEVSNAGYPYGLGVMFRLLGPWLYGGDPVTGLRLDAELTRLREDLKAGKVFEPMLQRDLLDNPHRVTLVVTPDPALAERSEQAERELVERLSKNFSDDDRKRIVADSLRLKELQGQESDPDVLPTLALSDIPAQVARPDYQTEKVGRATIGRVPQPTGGLSYLDVQIRLPRVPDDLLDVLPLYAYAVTRSGAAQPDGTQQDYVALARRIEAVTGGISASAGVGTAPDDLSKLRLSITFSGKALARNAPELVKVLDDVLARPEFDRERLRQLLEQRLAGMKASVVNSGNAYADRLASAQVSPAGAIEEKFGGLTALATLKDIVENGGLDALLDKFARLRTLILQGEPLICLTALPEDVDLDLSAIVGEFSGTAEIDRPTPALAARTPQARTTDSPVAFNAVAFQTVPYTHADNPALLVLSRLLRSEYLLKEIREKGGAYGGGAGFDARNGTFSMTSYRDPNIARTYGVYRDARKFLAESLEKGELTGRELTEAILGASKALDPLTSPDTIGKMRFFGDQAGLTPEVQEAYKARLLGVTLDDLRRVMDEYLTPERAAYALVAGKDPTEDTEELGLKWEVAEI